MAALAVAGPASPMGASDAGHLAWGFAASLRADATGPLAGGTIDASQGATVDATGRVRFPSQGTSTAPSAAYRGTVHLTGATGTIDVTLSNPRVDISGGRGTLVVDVTTRVDDAAGGGSVVSPNTALATLVLDGSAPTTESVHHQWLDAPATLTADGAAALGDLYPAGHPLEPVSFALPAEPPPAASAPASSLPAGPAPADDAVGAVAALGTAPAIAATPAEVVPAQVVSAQVVPAQAAGSFTVVGGAVDWGLRASFRSYIVGPIAHGSITTGAGASTNGDGTFRFPASSGGQGQVNGPVNVRTTGTVRFDGHDGELQIVIANVRVETTATTGTLVADVTTLPQGSSTPQTRNGVAFADLSLGAVTAAAAPQGWVLPNIPARLTAAGAEAFAGYYSAGQALDPVTVTVQVAETGSLPQLGAAPPAASQPNASTSGPAAAVPAGSTLADSGGTADPDLIAIALLLVALGIAALATRNASVRSVPVAVRPRP